MRATTGTNSSQTRACTDKLRILHAVLSSGFYGSERYCIDLALAQARAGHDVVVVGQDGRSDCAQHFCGAIAQARDGTVAGSVRTVFLPRALPRWLQRPAAQLLLRRFRPDVVHTHLNPAARRVGRVAERLGIAHVATLLIRYDARELESCDGLIAVNQNQRRTIPSDFRGETAVIGLWLSPAIERAIAHVACMQVEALRQQWDAGDADIVFGSVGRLTPAKGMDVLVRAFKTAFPAGEPVRLVMVGDGEDRGALEELAGGDQRIVFAGHQADIVPFYRAFDLFVSASRFEPFGLAIVEAMAAGCRLIVTRTDGPSEFLSDLGTLWAAPDSVDDLATQLRAAAPSGRGRADHDMSRLTVDRLAAEIEAFYRRVVRASNRSIEKGEMARVNPG